MYDIIKLSPRLAGEGKGRQGLLGPPSRKEEKMAKKIDMKELISFDELLAAEDLRNFFDNSGHEAKKADSLTQGVYFLLDDSRILLLNSRKYLNPQ